MKRLKGESFNGSQNKHIPPELLLEIMARLPAKSLVKFRCVCKNWYSLIDSSDFISMHLQLYNYNSDNTRLLVAEEKIGGTGRESRFSIRCVETFQIDRIQTTHKSYVVDGSCNGLVLIWEPFNGYRYINILRLWNPSIRKCLLLPPTPFNFIQNLLGFAPFSNDFKVVLFNPHLLWSSNLFSIAVYSLNDHIWRIKSFSGMNFRVSVHALRLNRRRYVFFQGVAYGVGGHPKDETHVVAFDFNLEEFSFIELPDAGESVVARSVFLLGESLALLSVSSESICIWVLAKNGEKNPWIVWLSGGANVDVSKFFQSRISLYAEILYIRKTGTFVVENSANISYYNIRDNKLVNYPRNSGDLMYFFSYVESLLLHKGSKGQTFTFLP